MLRKTEEGNDRKRKKDSEGKTSECGNGKCRITGRVRDNLEKERERKRAMGKGRKKERNWKHGS